jgi:large subunit ribosomal protein L9
MRLLSIFNRGHKLLKRSIMKVILEQNIPNVGQAGQIKEVSDGYARNYLLPRHLAAIATPSAVIKAERQLTKKSSKDGQQNLLNKDTIKKLTETVLVFEEKANEQGHLFASVNASAIVKSIRRNTSVAVDEAAILIDQPIKNVGRHTISIKLSNQTIQCNIDVQIKK